ncbi:hypothetical protein ACJJID_12825 [Microbulbifer sp. CnH-101-G]|uniref:hypothetical protein n=1 Tax=Microbulbifer sp. CnH-101-G TaxID=3243393 RepID=UPI00403987BC
MAAAQNPGWRRILTTIEYGAGAAQRGFALFLVERLAGWALLVSEKGLSIIHLFVIFLHFCLLTPKTYSCTHRYYGA